MSRGAHRGEQVSKIDRQSARDQETKRRGRKADGSGERDAAGSRRQEGGNEVKNGQRERGRERDRERERERDTSQKEREREKEMRNNDQREVSMREG